MANVSFSQAAGAYNDALKAAERIIKQAGSGQADESQSASGSSGSSFIDMVGNALNSAQTAGYHSEDISTKALSGKANLSDVITAVASAETSLNTVVAVRDKVISAYQEIIRMAI